MFEAITFNIIQSVWFQFSISYLCCHFTDSFSWIWVPVGSFHCFWGDVSKLDQVLHLCVSHIFYACVRMNLGLKRLHPEDFSGDLKAWARKGVKPPRLEGLMTTTPGGYDQRNQLCALPGDQCLWQKNKPGYRMIESSGGIFRLVKSWNSKVPEVFYHATVPRVTFQKARVSSAVCFMGKSQYNYCTLFLLKVICFEIVNISSHSLHIFTFRHFKSQVILI